MEREQEIKPARVREASSELVGSYLLLHEIARGEHTSVHLAKKHGPMGFQRLFALKRLRSGHNTRPEYVAMLLDEAHLTAGLHHANLVGVLDVGSESGCHVISDYVEGENLARLIERAGPALHSRYFLPLFVDTLNGLEAVHTALGADELPLEMVHQAPCARHVLVGVDGIARLTDFSQARAKTLTPSRARTERLRLSHMAPEQAISPESVDARTDLFIVGISLWEALTGEPLFEANSDDFTFQNVLHRRIPRPSEVGRRPPSCFDAVCLRALERDPKARFASAAEMARALRDVALNQALYATPAEIGAWVKSVLGAELRARRRKLGDMDTQQIRLAGVAENGKPQDASTERGGQAQAASALTLSDWDEAPSASGGISPQTYPIPRDDEPTSPRFVVEQESGRAKPRQRTSTLPFGSGLEPVRMPDEVGSGARTLDVLDSEPTRPNVFVPAALAGRRDVSVVSPGAYSQVNSSRTRNKRASVSPPPPPAWPTPASPFAALDEVQTHRYAEMSSPEPSLHGAPLGFKPKRPSQFPSPLDTAAQHTAESLGALQTSLDWPTPAVEMGAVSRADSVPSRGFVPEESVGAKILPSGEQVASVLESLPKTFEALRAEEAVREAKRLVTSDATRLATSDMTSLAPPNVAEWTLPPSEPRPRNVGAWVGSGLLAAVILLAMGVGARQWMLDGAQTAASTREAPGEPVQRDALPEELSEAAPGIDEAADAPLFAPGSDIAPGAHEERDAKPAGSTSKHSASSSRQRTSRAHGARDKSLEVEPAARSLDADSKPQALPAKPAPGPALTPIPDNPY